LKAKSFFRYDPEYRVKLFFFIFCNAVLCNLASPALAENENPYFARTWLAEDGLPDNRVVGLAQTADGYLWVATQGGVVRFDGIRFQRVKVASSPNLIAGTMRALMLDRAGRIWLAKDEGGTVFCFDGEQVRMISADQGLPKNETQHSLAMDGEGDLWVTYSTGKVVRYTHDGKVDTFTSKNGLPGGVGICWLACGRDGVLWFAKGSQVGVFRDGRFNVLESFGSPALRIAAAHSGGIWICAGQQVLKFDEGVETVELGKIIPNQDGGRSGFEPSVLLEDRDGAVWVGTDSGGLFRCDSNAITRVEVSSPAILSLTEDREGNLWVGTRGGLNRVHRRLTSMIEPADGLPFQEVRSVCQDTTGTLWLVGENGALVRGQGTNWVVQSPASGPVPAYVTCAVADTNGSVWIGGRRGALYRWAGGGFKDLGLQGELQDKAIRSLLATSHGDLWIGTDSTDLIYRLRGGKLQAFKLPPGYRFIRAMAEDAAGNVWVGASDGLLVCVTDDTLVDETAKSSSLSIRCLYGEANGDLWIGYAGAGAGRLRNGNITRFSTDQGLPNDYVSQILADNRGSLWFAGNQGIFQVRERDFDDLAGGVTTRLWPIVYGRSEGLPGLQASFDFCPDSLRASDDRLFFSMLSGLAEVRLDYARLNYRAPNVFIERVTADDRTFVTYQNMNVASSTNGALPAAANPAGQRDELRLPPGLQQVQFEFTALSFVAPENVQFRYQLEGLDKDWVDAGARRVASYTHPPPGHYRFKVIACNNDGIWNKIGDTLPVVFEFYFWEALWFKVAATLASFIVLCSAVVFILRRRHRLAVERLEHQRALEVERNRIARDLHDDLGVGLTEIGLLGDLAGTNGQLPPASRERLEEIVGRARTLAASLDEIVWAINPANDTSQSLVDYFFPYAQKLLGQAGIRCRLQVVEPLPAGNLNAEERHEFFHAFKEALNNIIRHSHARTVEVTFSAAKGRLMVCIADDGCGLKEAAGRAAHHGLTGMRERLQHLGGSCEIIGGTGGGTTVTFVIPVQPEI
jgi:ligand-binding sensor domain-containing protein/signal transduction histidine kinase